MSKESAALTHEFGRLKLAHAPTARGETIGGESTPAHRSGSMRKSFLAKRTAPVLRHAGRISYNVEQSSEVKQRAVVLQPEKFSELCRPLVLSC